MSDEKAKPIETKALSVTPPEVLDIRDASARGLALMEERVKHTKKIMALAISTTSPNQWVVFEGTGPNGEKRESVYPTGGAADRIKNSFGLTFEFTTPTVEDTEDGKLASCEVTVKAGNEVMVVSTGYRYKGGYVSNIASLYSGAKENAKSKAIRDLLGLRFLSKADYKDLGLNLDRLERRAEFQSHEKDPGEMTVPFGRDKGKPIADVDDKALQWVAEAVKTSIADPDKAKWKGKNEALYQALRAEYARRHPAEKPAEPATSGQAKEETPPPPTEEPPHDPETGEVTKVAGQPVRCAQPGCDSPATHGVYCGGHLPSQKGQGTLDMREPGEEG